MFDPGKMSPDEVFALICSMLLALVLWGRWVWLLRVVARFGRLPRARRILEFLPLAGAGLLWLVLKRYASHDVRDDPTYLLFYLVMGAAWVAVAIRFLPLAGLSVRDDVIERDNPAVALAVSGALPAMTLCFAGGNIGDGPGWWVVVFSAALATGGLLGLWAVAARFCHWADRLTIDRDAASGVRAAGFFLGVGLILGRAVAGDWESASATVVDFLKVASLAIPLAVVAPVVERMTLLRMSGHVAGKIPVMGAGAVLLGYVTWGLVGVWFAGPWK